MAWTRMKITIAEFDSQHADLRVRRGRRENLRESITKQKLRAVENTAFARICFALALAASSWAQSPNAVGILQKTAEKYANLTSTSFRAIIALIDDNQREGMTMEVAFRRPDKARLSVRGTGVGQAFHIPSNEVLVVVDGVYTWMTVPGWKQYTREAGGFVPDSSDANAPAKIGAAAGFVGRTVQSMEALVKQYAGTADKMKLTGEDRIHNMDCYVVESKPKKGPSKRLWIDKASHVLIQDESITKDGAVLRTSFSDITVNQPLPDSLFVFRPADGDALVELMIPPDRQQ